MKAILKNWKTTLAGAATIVVGILQKDTTAIVTGIGLILAHDGKSE